MKTAEKTERLDDLYVTAGDRLYAIGSQDGDFPRVGEHIPGEMTGIWVHPQKVLDGFWIELRWDDQTPVVPRATGFQVAPGYTEHHYQAAGEWSGRRRQWVPDGLPAMVVHLAFCNEAPRARTLQLTVWVRSNLRPGWPANEDTVRGRDISRVSSDPPGLWMGNDRHPPWQVLIAGTPPDAEWFVSEDDTALAVIRAGRDRSYGGFRFARRLTVGERVEAKFWIAAATEDWDCRDIHHLLANTYPQPLRAKARRLHAVNAASRLRIPERSLQRAYAWAKVQTDWLVRDVAGVGRGLGAGFPEYPWWFGCDNGYALRGALATGRFELAKQTVELLARASARVNGNGRIIHELSGTGGVPNPGNTQETAQFCQLMWEIFRWTGDRDFLERMLPYADRALSWLLEQAHDGDDLPYGYGIMEVEHLNLKLIDSAVYTVGALEAMVNLARIRGDAARASALREKAERLKETVRTRFWLPEARLFGDVIGSANAVAERLHLWSEIAAGAGRADVARAFADQVRSGDHEEAYQLRWWIINTPMEAGIASQAQAATALRRMREPDFRAQFGLYLSGYWQTHVMTISTGVQAVAEARYGYVDASLDWLRRMADTMDRRMPGSMSEMSPDYGCFVQAWTLYGLAVALVEYFFGLAPRAHERRVAVDCQMPKAWSWAELTDVKMADNALDLHYLREGPTQSLKISTCKAWRIDWRHPWTVSEASPGATRCAWNSVELPAGGWVTLVRPTSRS